MIEQWLRLRLRLSCLVLSYYCLVVYYIIVVYLLFDYQLWHNIPYYSIHSIICYRTATRTDHSILRHVLCTCCYVLSAIEYFELLSSLPGPVCLVGLLSFLCLLSQVVIRDTVSESIVAVALVLAHSGDHALLCIQCKLEGREVR